MLHNCFYFHGITNINIGRQDRYQHWIDKDYQMLYLRETEVKKDRRKNLFDLQNVTLCYL
jgi:hypothetical protein